MSLCVANLPNDKKCYKVTKQITASVDNKTKDMRKKYTSTIQNIMSLFIRWQKNSSKNMTKSDLHHKEKDNNTIETATRKLFLFVQVPKKVIKHLK